jgi:ApaG protein
MYQATTQDIRVTVEPQFMADRSMPDMNRYFWSYTIEIANLGRGTVTLRSRHWRITDAHGRQEEVRGPGVVGEEPVLEPGGSFTYTSGCPLTTPSGIMAGSYQMERPDGTQFDIKVPAFSLDSPFERTRAN